MERGSLGSSWNTSSETDTSEIHDRLWDKVSANWIRGEFDGWNSIVG